VFAEDWQAKEGGIRSNQRKMKDNDEEVKFLFNL
jgi:hypothetical protein